MTVSATSLFVVLAALLPCAVAVPARVCNFFPPSEETTTLLFPDVEFEGFPEFLVEVQFTGANGSSTGPLEYAVCLDVDAGEQDSTRSFQAVAHLPSGETSDPFLTGASITLFSNIASRNRINIVPNPVAGAPWTARKPNVDNTDVESTRFFFTKYSIGGGDAAFTYKDQSYEAGSTVDFQIEVAEGDQEDVSYISATVDSDNVRGSVPVRADDDAVAYWPTRGVLVSLIGRQGDPLHPVTIILDEYPPPEGAAGLKVNGGTLGALFGGMAAVMCLFGLATGLAIRKCCPSPEVAKMQQSVDESVTGFGESVASRSVTGLGESMPSRSRNSGDDEVEDDSVSEEDS